MKFLLYIFLLFFALTLYSEDNETVLPDSLTIGGDITGVFQGSPETNLWGGNQKDTVGASYQANITIDNEFENIWDIC